MTQDILSRITEFKTEVPAGATIEERLTSAAITLLHWGLDSERIALMRLAAAEARRFPDLASSVSRMARDLSTELGVRLLGQLAQSDELSSLPAFAPDDDMIETLTPDRSDQPFGKAILPRRGRTSDHGS